MQVPRQQMEKARIEIIPMIDIIFFLLVFFMVSTLAMTINRGLPVNLCPQRKSSPLPPQSHRKGPSQAHRTAAKALTHSEASATRAATGTGNENVREA
jgi:biopolymer transport protein ExbD